MSRIDAPRLEGRKVLITGATGFLGRVISVRLANHGAEVHGVSRTDRSSEPDAVVHWWRADLQDCADLERVWDQVQPSVVYHLAGEVNGAPSAELLIPTFHSLLTSTVNLLALAGKSSMTRLVLAGSLEEKDADDGDAPSMSPYAAAKSAASDYARMCHEVFGTRAVILRTFMSYGPGQPHWKIIPSTISSLLNGVPPRLSSGSRELDWVYVEDVADAFVDAAVAPGIEGMTLDVGSGHLTSIAQIVEDLVRLVDPSIRPVYGVLPDRPRRPPRIAEVAVTQRYLGWEPKTRLAEGLRRTVAWHRNRQSYTG